MIDESEITAQLDRLWADFETGFGERFYGDLVPITQSMDLLPNDDPKREQFLWEMQLQRDFRHATLSDERFSANWTNQLPDPAYSYFAERVNNTTNISLKALYADLLWTTEECERKERFQMVELATSCYRATSKEFWERDYVIIAFDAAARSLGLSLRMEQPKWITDGVAHISWLMDQNEDSLNHVLYEIHLLRFLVKSLKKLQPYLTPDVIRNWIEDRIRRAHLRKQCDRFEHQYELLTILYEFHKLQNGKDNVDAIGCRVALAQLHMDRAKEHDGNSIEEKMRRVHFCKEAMSIFIEIGTATHGGEIARLKKEIRATLGDLEGMKHSTFGSEIEVPTEFIEQVVHQYGQLDLREALSNVPVDERIFPSREKVVENARSLLENSILGHLPVRSSRHALVVNEAQECDELLDHWVQQIMLVDVRLRSVILTALLNKLMERRADFDDAFFSILRSSPLYSDNCLRFIENGLQLYWMREYVACIHLWGFQIEALLRALIERLGHPTYGLREGVMRERPLSEILKTLDDSATDTDLTFLVRCLLADVTGLNLRNDIGHGLADFGDLTREIADYLLLMLLRISKHGVGEVSDGTLPQD